MSKELFKMGVEEVEKIELYLSEFINLLHSHGYYNDLSREVLFEDLEKRKPFGFEHKWFDSYHDGTLLSDGSCFDVEINIKKTKRSLLNE